MVKNPTLFVDIDGTIVKYREFVNLYKTQPEPIQDVIDFVNQQYDEGAIVIITTARPEAYNLFTKQELEKVGVKYHRIIFNCGRGTRILLNDRDANDPHTDRAIGINFDRDKGFDDSNPLKKFNLKNIVEYYSKK